MSLFYQGLSLFSILMSVVALTIANHIEGAIMMMLWAVYLNQRANQHD